MKKKNDWKSRLKNCKNNSAHSNKRGISDLRKNLKASGENELKHEYREANGPGKKSQRVK